MGSGIGTGSGSGIGRMGGGLGTSVMRLTYPDRCEFTHCLGRSSSDGDHSWAGEREGRWGSLRNKLLLILPAALVLSVEIMVIALKEVIVEGFVQREIILVVVAFLITAIVYGVAALIVKMLLTAVRGVRCRAVGRCRPFSSDDLRLGGGATRSTARARSPHRRGPTRSCSSPTHQLGRRRSARLRCANLTISEPVVGNGPNRSGCSVPGDGLPEHRDTARSYEQANDDEHDAVEDLFAEQRNDSGDDENDGQKPENECHGLSVPSGGSCQTLQPTLHPVGPLLKDRARAGTQP